MLSPARPSGRGSEARFWQWVHDSLAELKPQVSPGFLTSHTTRGIFRQPMRGYSRQSENRRRVLDAIGWYYKTSPEGKPDGPVGYYVRGGVLALTEVDYFQVGGAIYRTIFTAEARDSEMYWGFILRGTSITTSEQIPIGAITPYPEGGTYSFVSQSQYTSRRVLVQSHEVPPPPYSDGVFYGYSGLGSTGSFILGASNQPRPDQIENALIKALSLDGWEFIGTEVSR